jgi:hypothetical protein
MAQSYRYLLVGFGIILSEREIKERNKINNKKHLFCFPRITDI